jgi:hypothetical protein
MSAPGGLMLTVEQERDLAKLLTEQVGPIPFSMVLLSLALNARNVERAGLNTQFVKHRASCGLCDTHEPGGAA